MQAVGVNVLVLVLLIATAWAAPAESRRQAQSQSQSQSKTAKSENGVVRGQVTVSFGGKSKQKTVTAVVMLEDVPGPSPAPMHATIHQHNNSFMPPVLVVTKGSTVDFPNDDKIFHNVFSLSRAARFDLGLYKSGTTRSVKMSRAGVVDVHCNIHPEMTAKIKVMDTSYYAVAAPDGTFQINDVPPGTYPIVVWQAFGDEYRGEVTVTAGGTAEVDIQLQEGKQPRHHLRKDGTPYGRYR